MSTQVLSSIIYTGRDNTVIVRLAAGNTAFDLTDSTRVLIKLGAVTFDSLTHPECFDWTLGNGQMLLKLGVAALSVVPPRVYNNLFLVTFSPTYPNGLAWALAFPVVVRVG
jgi:hypothetical protein